MSNLRISATLSLPLDFITKTCGILAQRRKGKTYTASVIAEELVAAKMPFVVLDPTGAWWGLRASADGKAAGLPVVILGGQHGDVPLERTGGKFVAELVIDEPGYYVIDFSLFESNEAERQFATDFAERLYRRKGQPNSDFAMHLIVDEADRFAPQQSPSGDKRMLGAFEAIVRRGGLRGLGTTLISQRAAVVNKNVLEQVDMLIVLRIVGPNDRKAILGYVQAHGSESEVRDMMDSLPSLNIGEAWVWEPGGDPVLFDRVQIRERRTFNSSATPKPGERRVEPRQLAEVDLEAIKVKMASTIERAKADDPVALRREITKLQRELHRVQAEIPKTVAAAASKVETVVERVEVIPEGFTDEIEALRRGVTEVSEAAARVFGRTEVALKKWRGLGVAERSERALPARGASSAPTGRAAKSSTAPTPLRIGRQPGEPVRRPLPPPSDDVQVKAGARRILETFARHYPMRMTRAQLGTLAKFKVTGGTFQTYFSLLKRLGFLVDEGNEISITEEGLAYIGEIPREPLTTEEVLDQWRSALKAGARKMLDVLVEAYPEWRDRTELAETVEMTESGGTFQTYLATLRRNGLVDVDGGMVRASDTLFLGKS